MSKPIVMPDSRKVELTSQCASGKSQTGTMPTENASKKNTESDKLDRGPNSLQRPVRLSTNVLPNFIA
jgi:hypothetical protein